MSELYRYEVKFILNEMNYSICKEWLNSETAFHKKYPNRIVNSIYLDDQNFSSVKDNLSGISERSKVRLRWYGDINTFEQKPCIENKSKKGRLGSKRYIHIDTLPDNLCKMKLYEILKIINNEKDFKLASAKEYLYPSLFVKYEREYFEEKDKLRITIDHNIQFSPPLVSRKISDHQFLNYNKRILEIKFGIRSKDYVSSIIRNLNLVPSRNSKYLTGLATLGQVNYL